METGANRDADRELDFHPVIEMRWEITKSSQETSGALFEATAWFDPHMPGPPPHVHPNAEESVEVLEGSLDVFTDGAWTTLRAGERATVPPNTPHSLRNTSGEQVKVVGRFQPAGRTETFFRHMQALISEGKITRLPPDGPRSAIYACMVFSEYPDVTRATGALNVFGFKTLTLVGKALRFKL